MQRSPGVVFEDGAIIKSATTQTVRLGSENRTVNDPGWDDAQVTGSFDVVAFSLRPVHVTFEDEQPVVLCPGVVALPGAATTYRRAPTGDAGQRTIFLSILSDRYRELIAASGPPGTGTPGTSRTPMFAPADPIACTLACRLERVVFEQHSAGMPVDPLLVDEAAAEILDRTAQYASAARTRASDRMREPSGKTRRRWRDIANDVAVELVRDPSEPPTLEALADRHELSPAYLARIFRHQLGQTMHECYSLGRLTRALERLPHERGRLTRLALECGFASHSHLTSMFRSVLGVTPSKLASESADQLHAHLNARLHTRAHGTAG